jgi:hypothetical protein
MYFDFVLRERAASAGGDVPNFGRPDWQSVSDVVLREHEMLRRFAEKTGRGDAGKRRRNTR